MFARLLGGVLLLALAGACALAQPDPVHPPSDPKLAGAIWMLGALDKGEVAMKTTPQGVFCIGHGVLSKLDPVTLEEQGTLELFGPKFDWSDAALANLDEGVAFLLERVRRLCYPNMAVAGNDLLIVMGEYYFRVDMATMKLKAASVLCDPDLLGELARVVRPEAGADASKFNASYLFAPAQFAVAGQQANLISNNQLTSIRITDGKVLAVRDLPAKLTEHLFPGGKGLTPNKPVAKAVDGKPFSVVGTVTKRADRWAITEANGAEYLLTGVPAQQLAADPNSPGTRAIVLGTFHARTADQPPCAGTLDATAYMPLPVAKIE